MELATPSGRLEHQKKSPEKTGRIIVVDRKKLLTLVSGALAPDHIHMLVASPPSLAPSKLVQYLKGRSSRKLQMEFEELKRRYWGQHLWARGYFCSTVGTVTDEIIKKYIEEQKWEDDGGKGFKIVPE